MRMIMEPLLEFKICSRVSDWNGSLIGLRGESLDKDSLVARLANESTSDAAEVIMDALYKAEQAAEDAAKASGALQEAT